MMTGKTCETIPVQMDEIIKKLKTSHKTGQKEKAELLQGYSYLKNHNNGSVSHSLDTALFIARRDFDYPVVLAAILHDFAAAKIEGDGCQELIDHFNRETIRILQVFHEIRHSLMDDRRQFGISHSLKKKTCYSEALFVLIAETIMLLEHSDSTESPEQLIDIAGIARNHLIPELKNIEAFELVDILENLCLKIEDNDMYTAILNHLNTVESYNGRYQHMVLMHLHQIFDPNSNIIPDELKSKYQPYIRELKDNPRSVSSIARYIETKKRDHSDDPETFLNNTEIPYWDITLILSDDIQKSSLHPKDVFFNYYEQYIQHKMPIYVLGYYKTTYQDSDYLLLCDAMNNQYRIFIKTEEEYLCYRLGTYIEKDKFRLDSNDHDNPMIKVYTKDGAVIEIEEGACVLDFAFKIHENLGLQFDYALLNNDPRHYPPYHQLKKGDTVTIHKSQQITASLNWFRYIKTSTALEKLIQHFNKKKDNEYIRVYTRDGTADRIENGATVLDLAFRIHTNLGLRFDYALINGSARRYPASTRLTDEDSVIIVGRDTVTADIQWFRYLKTDQAIDKLIKYFKNSIDQYVWLTENASRN